MIDWQSDMLNSLEFRDQPFTGNWSSTPIKSSHGSAAVPSKSSVNVSARNFPITIPTRSAVRSQMFALATIARFPSKVTRPSETVMFSPPSFLTSKESTLSSPKRQGQVIVTFLSMVVLSGRAPSICAGILFAFL